MCYNAMPISDLGLIVYVCQNSNGQLDRCENQDKLRLLVYLQLRSLLQNYSGTKLDILYVEIYYKWK